MAPEIDASMSIRYRVQWPGQRAISVHAGPTRRNPALERASIASSEAFDAPPRANAKSAPVSDGRVFLWPRAVIGRNGRARHNRAECAVFEIGNCYGHRGKCKSTVDEPAHRRSIYARRPRSVVRLAPYATRSACPRLHCRGSERHSVRVETRASPIMRGSSAIRADNSRHRNMAIF